MTNTPKDSSETRRRKPRVQVEEAPAEKLESPAVVSEGAEAPAQAKEEAPAKAQKDSPTKAKEEAPVVTSAPPVISSGKSVQEWLSVCKLHLGVRPWILRAATEGNDPGRKYTEDEIRKLIQRKLSEPA